MEAALQTHFQVLSSMNFATRLAYLAQITDDLSKIESTLSKLDQIAIFHDDGKVKIPPRKPVRLQSYLLRLIPAW